MKKNLKFGDIIVIALVLILTVLITLFTAGGSAEYVVIYVNGVEYAKYNLQGTAMEIDVTTEYGYNLVKISDGAVCIIDSNCKDKLDIAAGTIDKNGQSLVCLPNRVVVAIEGGTKTDATAF